MTKRPWTTATGLPATNESQAAVYLRLFDHDTARDYDQPEMTLAKVVSNLRNYFGMSLDQTVMLMAALFNPRAGMSWSTEAVSLAWDLVAGYAPALGIRDPDAQAKLRAALIEDEVMELLAGTRSGKRVKVGDLWALLSEWTPDLNVTKWEFGHAIRMITGIESGSSRGVRYYSGFHLPTAQELMDPNHQSGTDTGTVIPSAAIQMTPPRNVVHLVPRSEGTQTSACF